MDVFEIRGGNRLRGRISISGAKNAALPILAATLLTEGETVLENVPELEDVRQMADLLIHLGCRVERAEPGLLKVRVEKENCSHAPYELVSRMRASVCVMGPLLGKRHIAQVSMPGGCAIGDRPIGLHIAGCQALGADFELVGGDVLLRAKKLLGQDIFLGGPFGSSVTATANVMMAAVLAEGRTCLESAACEPEVVDLAEYLLKCGAKIQGHGTPRILIEGVAKLTGCRHRVIPDRIEAGTFMIASAMTNGDVDLMDARPQHLMGVIDRLRQVGVIVRTDKDFINVTCSRRLEPIDITTQPYPGYPTDLQAQTMALLSLADGNSVITEKVFPDRFMHVGELNRMGAQLRKEGPTVIAHGVRHLVGAPVMASDLRASAALVLGGLVARGRTRVRRVYHIDRGYERIEEKLNALGADIERMEE